MMLSILPKHLRLQISEGELYLTISVSMKKDTITEIGCNEN